MQFTTTGQPFWEAYFALSKPKLIQTCRIMKLIAILLTVFCMHVTGKGVGQTITLSVRDVALKEVFGEIQKKAGFLFVYEWEAIEKAAPVSISVKDAGVREVLDLCLKNQPFTYVIDDNVIIIKPKRGVANGPAVAKPEVSVKGKVTNEDGEPVAGVVVRIKGTDRFTTTDELGDFVLPGVPENAVLVFSSLNMLEAEVKLNGKSQITVQLQKKITDLANVEVTANTGYQTVKPNEVTGSLVLVDNKRLNEQTGTNILKRLDGVTSGLLFDNNKQAGKGNLTIRGLSTINGPMAPLIVLDGFIYEGNIDNINPNLVESVTVLKDAAASSIWGARAGNGVIVITTKKGRYNQKMQVGVSANITIRQKPDLYALPQMNPADAVDVEAFLFDKGFFNGRINRGYLPLTPVAEILLNKRNGQISSEDSARQINALKDADIRDEFSKYFYRSSVIQQYAVNVSGGSANNAYTLSLGYDRSFGELQNKSHKVNIQFENEYAPSKNLRVRIGAHYTSNAGLSGGLDYNNGTSAGERYISYGKFTDDEGNAIPIAINWHSAYTDTAGAGKLLNWKYYPLEEWKHSELRSRTEDMFATAGVRYNLLQCLNIDLSYQYQKQQSESEQIYDLESYTTRNQINLFSQLDRSTGIINYIVPLGAIRAVGSGYTESQTGRGQVNFNKKWSNHRMLSILGTEIREARKGGDSYSLYGYSADPLTSAVVDYRNQYPTFITGAYSGIGGSPVAGRDVINKFISVYGNASYTYKENYSLSASARKDGSNIFGVHANDRWKPLWSVGAMWRLSDEAFFISKLISRLHLRATFGASGNVDLSKTALPLGTYGTAQYTNLPYARVQTLNNPDLRWEKSEMFNIGLDFSIAREIVSGSIEYYLKKGTDLYGETPYDYTAWGYSNVITANTANMKGHGFDIVVSTRNIDRKIKWMSSLLLNYNKDEVTKYYTTSPQPITRKVNSVTGITPVVGYPVYGVAAYKWAGLNEQGDPQGYVISEPSTDYRAILNEGSAKGLEGNIVFLGASRPKIFGSLQNSFSWRGIRLSIMLSYKLGHYFRKPTINYDQLINYGIGNKEYAQRWQRPGDELKTNVPAFIYPNNSRRDNFYSVAEVNILKADHIRFQYINLSYGYYPKSGKKYPFKYLECYINAADLGMLWTANKFGIDPDYPNVLPPTKNITFGIRTNF